TLEEFFQKMTMHREMDIHIELKNDPMLDNDLEKVVLQLSADHQMENQVVYSSFDHQLLKRLATLEPTAKIGLLFNTNLIQLFDYIKQTRISIHSLHPKHSLVTKEMVQVAHQQNIQVNPYTVNSKRVAKKLEKMGVDGIITNNPKILSK